MNRVGCNIFIEIDLFMKYILKNSVDSFMECSGLFYKDYIIVCFSPLLHFVIHYAYS